MKSLKCTYTTKVYSEEGKFFTQIDLSINGLSIANETLAGQGDINRAIKDEFFAKQKKNSIWQFIKNAPYDSSRDFLVEAYVEISKDGEKDKVEVIAPFNGHKIIIAVLSKKIPKGMTRDEILVYYGKVNAFFCEFVAGDALK